MSVKDQTIPRILALFALISAGIVLMAVYAVRNINRSVTSSDWVNATHATINELSGLAASLEAGEGNFRLYALSGSPADQAASRHAYAAMADHFEVIKAYARDDAARQARVLRLEAAAGTRADFARQVMAARTAGQADTVRALLTADSDKTAFDEILREIGKLKTDTMALLAERDQAAYLQAQATRWTVWAGVAVNFLLLAGAAVLIYTDLRLRRRTAAALEAANANLESKVRERTAELTTANAQLSTQNLERHWANQALEHQLRYDRLIISSISDLVFVLTKAANISRINPAVTDATGWMAQDLVNRLIQDFVRLRPATDAEAAPLNDPIMRSMKDGRDLRELPAVIRNRRDQDLPVLFTLFPLRDGNKIVGGIVVLKLTLPHPPGAPDRPAS